MPGCLDSLMTLLMAAKRLTRVLIHGSCSRSSLGFAWAAAVAMTDSDNHCFTANAIINFSGFATAIRRWQEWFVYAAMTKNPSTSTLLGSHCLGVFCASFRFAGASLYLQ